MRSLRANQQKLIEQILKKQDALLKSDIPDYFKDIKASNERQEELSDESSYKTETEVEDSFDADFDESEDESPEETERKSDDTDPRITKKSKPKSKIITTFKNKKDKYFKKGFDIKQLNFEILITEQPIKAEKPKKKRKAVSDQSKMKHNFLHEAYPQTVLLKNALTIERQNMHVEDGNAIYTDQNTQESPAMLLASKSKSIDYLKKIVLDSQNHQANTRLYFPNREKYIQFFSDIMLVQEKCQESDTGLIAKRPGKFSSVAAYKAFADVAKSSEREELHRDYYFCQGLLSALEEKKSKVKTN